MSKTPIEDVRGFLQKNLTAVLATSYQNLPHASAVNYVVDAKLNFYFATTENTDKHLNLTENKNVALVVGTGPKHISVQIRGHATALKDEKQKNRILNQIKSILDERRIENWPIKKINNLQAKKKDSTEIVVYKIIPQHMVFLNLDDDDFPDSISTSYHAIIPAPKAPRS